MKIWHFFALGITFWLIVIMLVLSSVMLEASTPPYRLQPKKVVVRNFVTGPFEGSLEIVDGVPRALILNAVKYQLK